MRFTKVQVALYLQDIPFVHMAPDELRAGQALYHFIVQMSNQVKKYDLISDKSKARFMICTRRGESTDHVPVLFIEDSKDMKDQLALDHARYIASPINGVGPIIIDN